jgi:hypothetical protein
MTSLKKIIFLIVLGIVPFVLFYALVIGLINEGFFDFLYSWPLVLSYLFFLLLTVLISGFSMKIADVLISPLILEGYCTRRFLRLMCTFEASKTESKSLLHVKDVVDILLFSAGPSMLPFIAFVWRGVTKGVYPPDVFPLVMTLFFWPFLWTFLVRLIRFRKYRYAEGLSFRETLQEPTLYTAEKKFESTAFLIAVGTLAMYWMSNGVIAFFNNPPASFYHFIVVLVASMATPIVLAVVLGWALDVFTRRLFGEALGKFLFATFVAGAVFHPLLGLLSTFFFSWALFGKAKDAAVATAITALSLFIVMLPGLIWTSVFLL